jgi:hypothetical protein
MAAGGEDARACARDPRPVTFRAHRSVSAATGRSADARTYVAFREALLDLVDEPTPANVQRYLGASRKLELATPQGGARRISRT